MRQVLGFLGVIAFILVCAWGIVHEFKREPPPADEVAFSYASDRLESAAGRLEQTHDYLGSYVGVDRDLFVGLDIAWANEDRYCLQLAREGGWYHLAGPDGEPARGACTTST